MKEFKITIILLAISLSVYSQTNTLPTTGKVGVGTTSPAGTRLNIVGTSTIGSTGNLSNSWALMGTTSFGLGIDNNEITQSGHNLYLSAVTGNIFFRTGTAERMSINASGNVGVGETTPDFPLQVRTPLETSDPVSYALDITRENDGTRGLSFGMATDNSYAVIGANNADLKLGHTFGTGSGGQPVFYSDITIKHNDQGTGKVGIGTTSPDSELTVNGTIHSKEVKVDMNITVPDYVFESDYELRTLKETKEYIAENKHLPEIPSAAEIGENGINLGKMDMRLLKKIEELTLYQIQLMEKLEEQGLELEKVKTQLKLLED